MYYYRDKDARGIDIVLEHDGALNPIEIKKSSNPSLDNYDFIEKGKPEKQLLALRLP